MGSKSTQNSTQNVDMETVQQMLMDPAIKKQLGQGYSSLANVLQQRLAAPLELSKFGGFSSTPDAIVQNLLSRGIQDINAKDTATQASLMNALNQRGTGQNMALGAAMAHRAALANAGARNALIPQAMQQQREFDVTKQGILQNQNAQSIAARGQLMQELGIPLQALGQLQNLGVQTGKNVGTQKGTNTTNTTTRSRSGIFGLF